MSNKRILLVDDDVDFAESQAELPESRGYDLTLTHSGVDALARVKESDYDLVLLDMKMPGMNGMECLMELRRLRPGLRVVMVSAFTQGEFVRQALEGGAFAVLAKPVAPEKLLDTLSFLSAQASILVVEDDVDLSAVVAIILRRQGYAVEVAASVKEGREALNRSRFDLLLLDYDLSDGTAADLLDYQSANGDRPSAVIVTGFPDQALATLPSFSAENVVVKPFKTDQLLTIIRKHDSQPGAE